MRRKEREISELNILEDIIQKADVCRIAFANQDIPYLVTMNFGYCGDPVKRLYFHCAGEGRKLEMLRKNHHVCFEMDIDHKLYGGPQGCDWGMSYSSVVGYGNISEIDGKEARIAGLNCIMKHYGTGKEYSYDDEVLGRTTILMLEITQMTGKKC